MFRVLTDPLLVDCPAYRKYALGSHRNDAEEQSAKVTVAVVLPCDNPGVTVTGLSDKNFHAGFYQNPRISSGQRPIDFGQRRGAPGSRNFIHPDIRTDANLSISWLWREGLWPLTDNLPENHYYPFLSYLGRFFPLSVFSISDWELISSRTTTISRTVKESHYAYRRTRTDANAGSDSRPVPDAAAADRRS